MAFVDGHPFARIRGALNAVEPIDQQLRDAAAAQVGRRVHVNAGTDARGDMGVAAVERMHDKSDDSQPAV